MRYRIALFRIVLFGMMLSSGLASITATEPASTTISALEQAALERHPVILGYEQKIQALNGSWVQAGLAPNPEVSYMAEDLSAEAPFGDQMVIVSQEMVPRWKREQEQAVVCGEIQTAKETLRMARIRLQTDVRVAAIACWTVQNMQVYVQEMARIQAQIYQLSKQLYEKGELSRLMVWNSLSDSEKSQQALAALDVDGVAAWRRLAATMGNPGLPQAKLTDRLDGLTEMDSWERCVATLKESSPEIAQAAARITEAKRRLQREESQNVTNVTLEGGMGYSGEVHGMKGQIGLSVPLRIRDRNQGAIAEARGNVLVAQSEYERVLLSVQERLAEQYRSTQNALGAVKLYQESLLPQTEEALRFARSGQEQGEMPLLDYLSLQLSHAEMQANYIEAMGEYWTQKTILEGHLLTGSLENSLF